MPDSWRKTDGFDVFMTSLICLMLGLAPLALGSVAPWARSVLFGCSLILLSTWLVQGVWRGELRTSRTPVWWFIIGFFALALFQLLPLSGDYLRLLSPETYRVYGRALGGYGGLSGTRTLSLSTHATEEALTRYFILAAVFFTIVNTFRRRWQVVALILTLVAVGSFEALYGIGEQFSGHKHIFWIERTSHLSAVTGTFHNKNHFAGLLEMIVPACLGLLFGLAGGGSGRSDRLSFREKALRAMSRSRLYQQVALAVLAVIMFVAVFFSLSRAGTIAALLSLVGFLLVLGFSVGFRRYTIVMICFVGAILLISTGIGMQLVVERMENVFNEHSTSWWARLDLARSALPYIGDYPVFGSGLGTFRDVFPRYQSPYFGDRAAHYLHNDWLQLFCEMGVIGGILLIGGLVWYLSTVIRTLLDRRIAFSRWVAAGCVLGAGAMIVHSFFDYNLSKITSNGLVFAALLAVGYVASRLPGRRKGSKSRLKYWRVPLDAVPARVAAVGLAVVVAGAPAMMIGPAASADIHLNRYMAHRSEPDDYFFLPVDQPGHDDGAGVGMDAGEREASRDPAADHLRAARRAEPDNPEILYQSGLHCLDTARHKVRRKAERRARRFLGRRVEKQAPETFKRVVETFSTHLRAKMLSTLESHLRKAKWYFAGAVALAPTRSVYHVRLAEVHRELDPDSDVGLREARTALWLAPNKPWVLHKVGCSMLMSAGENADDRNKRTARKALDYLQKAIRFCPSYTDRIYPFIATTGRYEALKAVTPDTTRAYSRLCRMLRRAEKWGMLLDALEKQEKLAKELKALEPVASAETSVGVYASPRGVGAEWREPGKIMLSVAQRRVEATTRLGRWENRDRSVEQYRDLLADRSRRAIDEAERLREMGRSTDAMRLYLETLRRDWSNASLLLAAARTASLPAVAGTLPPWQRPIDHLYRLVLRRESLSGSTYKRLCGILDTLPLEDPADALTAEFIRGVGAVKSSEYRTGRDILEGLTMRVDTAARKWRQDHLVWFYLGRAYQAIGNTDEARACFEKVLRMVPAHRQALLHIQQQGAGETGRLEKLTPDVSCRVNFEGKCTLLGYESRRKNIVGMGVVGDAGGRDTSLRLFWRMDDRMHRSYRLVVTFFDAFGHRLFRRRLRFADGEGVPYPVESPRCGEVVVVPVPLPIDLDNAASMEVQIQTPLALDYLSRKLRTDGGLRSLTIPLRKSQMAMHTGSE